jgi:hypothetical protein
MAAAYSVRPKPDARVSAPVGWDELRACRPEDFTLRTMVARFQAKGDVQQQIDDRADDITPLLDLSARQVEAGQGDAPWPPQYRKQEDEPPRVQPSRRKRARPPADAATSPRRTRARVRKGS